MRPLLLMKKILFVDDSMFIRKFFGPKIQNEGYQVVTANDGKEAINKASTMQPALIIMDIDMPGMDGVSAAKSLKGQSATNNIPIIIASAHITPDVVFNLTQLGIKDYIAKPYSPEKLLEKIKTLLK